MAKPFNLISCAARRNICAHYHTKIHQERLKLHRKKYKIQRVITVKRKRGKRRANHNRYGTVAYNEADFNAQG